VSSDARIRRSASKKITALLVIDPYNEFIFAGPPSIDAALAYSIAGSGNHMLTSGLNDFVWAGFVLTSFPRAMLIMAAAFGLWRARLISNALFAAGVAGVMLVLLGGTTWLSGGFWAPDGVYSRLVSPTIGLVWGVVVSAVLLTRSPATRAAW
jgi:hypothetical protein